MNNDIQRPADNTWIQVAETWGDAESAIVVGLLHAANIPTYIDQTGAFPIAALGQIGGPGKVYVPAGYYQLALNLLDEDEDDFDDEDDDLLSLLDNGLPL
jgi:hypothetical protein